MNDELNKITYLLYEGQGEVTKLHHMGTDATPAHSARVSFNKDEVSDTDELQIGVFDQMLRIPDDHKKAGGDNDTEKFNKAVKKEVIDKSGQIQTDERCGCEGSMNPGTGVSIPLLMIRFHKCCFELTESIARQARFGT